MTDYERYRGKCKEESEKLAKEKGYILVRGYYYEPLWNREEPHWWCVDEDGVIHDPTRKQFPSGGIADFYTEFDGTVECAECGKIVEEKDIIPMGNYACCSDLCAMKLVGLA